MNAAEYFFNSVKSILVRPKASARWKPPFFITVFNAATPPIMWQVNLDNQPDISFTVEQDLNGEWDIFACYTGEAKKPIAKFETRDDAWESFRIVQGVMLNRSRSGRGRWHWLPAFLAGASVVLLTLVAFFPIMRLSMTLGIMVPPKVTAESGKTPAAAVSPPEAAVPSFPKGKPPEGVPVDADQALKPPPM